MERSIDDGTKVPVPVRIVPGMSISTVTSAWKVHVVSKKLRRGAGGNSPIYVVEIPSRVYFTSRFLCCYLRRMMQGGGAQFCTVPSSVFPAAYLFL